MNRHSLLTWVGIGIMLTLTGIATAKEDEKEERRNPLGCVDVGYAFELKTLNLFPQEAGERNSLYFILNKSNRPINLYQMRQGDSSYSMYLNHEISPNRWAVLSTCEKEIKYVCTIEDKKSKYGKVVDCAENLQVCEFARVRFGLNNRGNHWIVNSNTRGGAVREVVHYGIIPQ
ncbi:endopeptidase IV [Legionella impletisoli]|uniref:Endopeptidase IV n=1 Tax=Legionella impletisoli TaxID=343510 RepID=A0A917JUS0_9GAMM|nr:endopeptidase IV [Legionella impletisoli]GGI85989.1 endopeptidase IV [Legionella impletisoli]